MSYTPPPIQYELGTTWVPLYLNGQIFMVPIRPKPIQPPPPPPKPDPWAITPSPSRYGPDWDY